MTLLILIVAACLAIVYLLIRSQHSAQIEIDLASIRYEDVTSLAGAGVLRFRPVGPSDRSALAEIFADPGYLAANRLNEFQPDTFSKQFDTVQTGAPRLWLVGESAVGSVVGLAMLQLTSVTGSLSLGNRHAPDSTGRGDMAASSSPQPSSPGDKRPQHRFAWVPQRTIRRYSTS